MSATDEDALIMKLIGNKYPKFTATNMDGLRAAVRNSFVEESRWNLRASAWNVRKTLVYVVAATVLVMFWMVYVVRSHATAFGNAGMMRPAFGISIFCGIVVAVSLLTSYYWRRYVTRLPNDTVQTTAYNVVDALLTNIGADTKYSDALHSFGQKEYSNYLKNALKQEP